MNACDLVYDQTLLSILLRYFECIWFNSVLQGDILGLEGTSEGVKTSILTLSCTCRHMGSATLLIPLEKREEGAPSSGSSPAQTAGLPQSWPAISMSYHDVEVRAVIPLRLHTLRAGLIF